MTQKKLVTVLCTDDWQPEMRALTFPLFKYFARKIGADFHVIRTRAFPTYPLCYERFQIYNLSQNYDWIYQFDADVLLHPDMPDISPLVSKDTVVVSQPGLASQSYHSDEYFLRDGRNLCVGIFFTLTSNWTRDFWNPPLDLTPQEAMSRCTPKVFEWRERQLFHDHVVIDYLISRNVARFGIKVKPLQKVFEAALAQNYCSLLPVEDYIMHNGSFPNDKKLAHMKNVLQNYWKLDPTQFPVTQKGEPYAYSRI
jgi:hypothetical protein